MKLISLWALALLLFFPLLVARPYAPGNAKITKNEAQHIALKQYPGAWVTAAKLETVQGTLIWSIQITSPHAKPVAVAVDARSGRVVTGKKETR